MRAALRALIFTCCVAGCASRPALVIRGPRLRYPVSMSPVIYGPGYEFLSSRELDVVRSFTRTRASCQRDAEGRHEWDVSDVLNRTIELHGGEAVTNLSVRLLPPGGEPPEASWLDRALSCVPVELSGQVVRRRARLVAE